MTKWMIALMAGTAVVPVAARAQPVSQEAADESRAEEAGDIVVTAQRFEQRLQDVPISVSAVDGEDLRARGAQELSDLQYAVPGLSTYSYGVGVNYTQLRGVSNTNGGSTIGTYFDETPLSLNLTGGDITVKLLDMERVEVLRGPQASLYGEASMGGTIRYIPAVPRLDAISGFVDGQYGWTKDGASNQQIHGILNLPIATDTVGLRLVAGYEHVGGYIDSLATGAKDINSADYYTVRATLLMKPTERLTVSLIGLYEDARQDNQNFGKDRKTSALIETPLTDEYYLLQAKADYDLDFAVLSGSASYIHRDVHQVYDISPFYVPLFQLLGFPPGFVTQVGLVGDITYKIFNSELRLASQGQGRFHWQLGASYRDFEQAGSVISETAPGTLPFTFLGSDSVSKSSSYTLYGEASYDLTDRLTATAGLRYFRDDRSLDAISTSLGVTVNDVGDASFDTLNPRFNLRYEFTPDSMVYANVAKGFRSGGFNNTSAGGGVFVVPPTFEPDQIWTYEVGTKHQLFGNRLMLDAALYYSDWSNVQSNSFVPGSTLIVVNNSGNVDGWGVDLSATWRPIRALSITGTYGWNNLAYKEATADKNPGDPVDGAVRESWSASLDYRPRISDGVNGVFRVDYQHAADARITVRNFPNGIIERPGRDLVNLRVGAEFGRFELAFFANNLLDEDNPLIIGPFGVVAEDLQQRPRVIGISGNMRF